MLLAFELYLRSGELMTLRAIDLVPPVPVAGPIENVIHWVLMAQCFVCKYAGFENLTPKDFGAPLGLGKGPGGADNMQGFSGYAGLETPYGLDSDVPDQRNIRSRNPATDMRMPGM